MQFSIITKTSARKKALQYRTNLDDSDKKRVDRNIIDSLKSLREYKNAKTIYIYVSKANEIDTFELIENALNNGKKVAVPKCIDKTEMAFYYIDSLSQLEVGNFGVLEPSDNLIVANDTENAFMIVPCMAADIFGYRVGYGKGFYDRYLQKNQMPTAALCYKNQLYFKILHGRFDYKCNYIITEDKIFK